tara:strand:- start:2167 stop:2352 length:186 start_codon:yes stop_codon:yes gene_type:complete
MAVAVHVVRHNKPEGEADTVEGSYAKAIDDIVGSAAKDEVQIASAWDADTGSVVTTILLFS